MANQIPPVLPPAVVEALARALAAAVVKRIRQEDAERKDAAADDV
jgi:hypothetical protein